MTRVDTRVPLDPAVLAGVDELARVQGRSREDVIEDSLRRTVASRTLQDLLAVSRSRSRLDDTEADDVAAAERRSWRDERRASKPLS